VLAAGGGGFNNVLASAELFVAPTSTAVSCTPGTVAVGTPSQCMATVTDTASSGPSTPVGTVAFNSSGPSSFSPNSSCTLSEASAGAATCSVSYTPNASGATRNDTITATYGGDSAHAGSSGTAAVAVRPTSGATAGRRYFCMEASGLTGSLSAPVAGGTARGRLAA
jgi:hypothetical protein